MNQFAIIAAGLGLAGFFGIKSRITRSANSQGKAGLSDVHAQHRDLPLFFALAIFKAGFRPVDDGNRGIFRFLSSRLDEAPEDSGSIDSAI